AGRHPPAPGVSDRRGRGGRPPGAFAARRHPAGRRRRRRAPSAAPVPGADRAPATHVRIWTAPEVTGWGRLPMHAVPHPDRVPLDGAWAFQLRPGPEAPPGAHWTTVDVPGCWTMQDVGDRPQYTNERLPWDEPPVFVPEANPTGVY